MYQIASDVVCVQYYCISVKQAKLCLLLEMHSERASDQSAWFRVVNLHVVIILLLSGRFFIPQMLLRELVRG